MNSINNVERFKEKIRSGGVCVGTGMSDPSVSELSGQVGYDFLWIDIGHPPMDLQHVLGHIMAARGTGTASIVRVPGNDPDVIKPVIDMAPAGIPPRWSGRWRPDIIRRAATGPVAGSITAPSNRATTSNWPTSRRWSWCRLSTSMRSGTWTTYCACRVWTACASVRTTCLDR